MKIVTWNINSVRARVDRLTEWLRTNQPDVLCLQELKCQDEQFPYADVQAAGYHAVTHGQKTYNGVAILAPEGVEIENVERGMGDDVEDDHARVIAATVGGVRVVSVYVPNGQAVGAPAYAYKLEWYARLARYLSARASATDRLVLCGDFNVAPEARDVHDPALWTGRIMFSEAERAAWRAAGAALGLVDTFRIHHPEGGKFSWWDYQQLGFPKNLGLRIDHVLATRPLAETCADAGIDREARKGVRPSDHAPCWATFRD